jgi:hypothetical protein
MEDSHGSLALFADQQGISRKVEAVAHRSLVIRPPRALRCGVIEGRARDANDDQTMADGKAGWGV